MITSILFLLILSILIALAFQIVNILKIQDVYRKTGGKIENEDDLLLTKGVINFSMEAAMVYIVFAIVFVVLLFVLSQGKYIMDAIKALFLFGIITLPIGFIGKNFEKKIKEMNVITESEEIRKRYKDYLEQWGKAQFRIREES
ncbi:hypothetical protein KAU43_04390 [candidate division WOR-3 bacterium]|nr:hypothetical protein [candidate division WOR-3 bacterium]